MTRVMLFVATAAILLCGAADRSSAKERKQPVGPPVTEVKRSLFSGSESHIFNFGWLRADCTIPIVDIRMVKDAAHGVVRFEEAKTVVTARKSEQQKRCFGKSVDAVRMYYKANDHYVGKERVLIDVDTKLGKTERVAFTIDVR